MMDVPKLHHYLARAYLKRFTDENGDLWVLDRAAAKIRRQRPEVTAVERELYSLDLADGQDRMVEQLLADHVDGPGLKVIAALAAGAELKEGDREPLAGFVGALYLRTPSFREQQRQFGEQMRGALRRMGVESSDALDDADPPALESGAVRADVLLEFIEAARSTRRPYQNDFVSLMVSLLPKITTALLTMDWIIVRAPRKKSFMTSDAPVVITRPHGHNPLLGVGLATPGAEKVIPLTSEIALLVWDVSDTPRVQYGVIDRDRLRGLNEMLARNSQRFSISCSEALLRSVLRQTRLAATAPPRLELVGGND